MPRFTRFTVLLLTVAVLPWLAHAQSTFATITGTVNDATGAVLPGVEVTAVHKTLGLTYNTLSNDAGVFTLPELREGEYTVRATKAGFKEFIAGEINLVSRAVRRVDIRMELGTLTEKVEVTAEATAIETERATISTTRSQQELNKMPLSANSLYFMFMTLPMTQPRGSSPSFAGSRNDQYQMSVDGASINSGTGGVISNLANQTETFKEMKVEMVNNTAEHSGLGHVILLTKSGENQVHGNVFYNYQSPAFRARNFFSTDRASGIDHEYGFNVGGPVYIPKVYDGRNRTFWYLTADRDGASQLREELTPTVPLERWRKGDFSGEGVQIRNPITGEIYKDGKIPASALNPVALKYQDRFWPLPNVGDPNVFANRNHLSVMRGKDSQEHHMTAKVDQRFTDADYFFTSFQVHQVDVNDWDGALPTVGWKDQKRLTKNVSVGYSHTFGPQAINEFRFSHAYNGFPMGAPVNGLEIVNMLGLQGLFPNLPDAPGLYKVSFSGLGVTAPSQTEARRPGSVNKNTNLYNDFSFFQGRHNMKAGIQLGFVGYDNQEVGSATFGTASFNGSFSKVPGVSKSGHPYADFLMGVPNTVNRGAPRPLEQRRRRVTDFYIQDDWKVSQRLTLNLGMRYEYHAPWTEKSGMVAAFDRATGKLIVADSGIGRISPAVPTNVIEIVKASSVGRPAESLMFADKNNFMPRVSAAFRPFNNNSTVVSAGYGIFYDMTPYQPSMTSVPFVRDEPAFQNPSTPVVIWPVAFPSQGTGKASLSIPGSQNPNLVIPYTQQWNFTIQHERWGNAFRASYVGTATRQMTWSYDLNSPVVDDRPYNAKPRQFPQYSNISFTENGGNHTYQALSLETNRRMKNGLLFQGGYTWARDLGDDTSPEDYFSRSRERAPEQILPNQRFVGLVMYQLPFGRGGQCFNNAGPALDKVIGGWELAVSAYFQSGQHLTPLVSMPDPTGTRYTNSGRAQVSIRPDLLSDPNLPKDVRDYNNWFDVNAFGLPPIGRFGTSARGVIDGPGVNVWHAALHKAIRLTSEPTGPRFTVGLTASNLFNHTNFANPGTTLTTATTAAKITGVGGPNSSNPGDRAAARLMYLRLRLEW